MNILCNIKLYQSLQINFVNIMLNTAQTMLINWITYCTGRYKSNLRYGIAENFNKQCTCNRKVRNRLPKHYCHVSQDMSKLDEQSHFEQHFNIKDFSTDYFEVDY